MSPFLTYSPLLVFHSSVLHCSIQLTYLYTGHPHCTCCSERDSDGTLSWWGNSPLDSLTCSNGPATSMDSHSSDNEKNFLDRMHTVGHMVGIHHCEEILWERDRERGQWAITDILWWCMFICHQDMRNTGQAPLTLHHTRSTLKVKITATVKALLDVLAYDTPFWAFFTVAGRLVCKSTRWTIRCTGLSRSQKITWRHKERQGKEQRT